MIYHKGMSHISFTEQKSTPQQLGKWHRVIIPHGEDLLAEKAKHLIQDYNRAWEAAEFPADAEVFTNNISGQGTASDRIYFFSPKAAVIAADVLRKFAVAPCDAPDFTKVRKIRL